MGQQPDEAEKPEPAKEKKSDQPLDKNKEKPPNKKAEDKTSDKKAADKTSDKKPADKKADKKAADKKADKKTADKKADKKDKKDKKADKKNDEQANDEKVHNKLDKNTEQGQPKENDASSKHLAASRPMGDIWWSNEMNRAARQTKEGIKMSGEAYIHQNSVFVKFIEDGFEWEVPHLVPADLGRAMAPDSLAGPKVKAAKKRVQQEKPVPDFLLDVVRARYATQGPKHPPIIKVEVREDRNNLSSKWRQKFQVVVKASEEYWTPTAAMNLAITFCNCYKHMLLNPSVLDFKECRDALMHYSAKHDWREAPLDWSFVADLCLKPFPKMFPNCNVESVIYMPHLQSFVQATLQALYRKPTTASQVGGVPEDCPAEWGR